MTTGANKRFVTALQHLLGPLFAGRGVPRQRCQAGGSSKTLLSVAPLVSLRYPGLVPPSYQPVYQAPAQYTYMPTQQYQYQYMPSQQPMYQPQQQAPSGSYNPAAIQSWMSTVQQSSAQPSRQVNMADPAVQAYMQAKMGLYQQASAQKSSKSKSSSRGK
ncbi:hypothetical protein ANO11243_043070 [Dothideomycetidae sp. 11243]|nr:hypothetical protein ANO11243_043070 [fungal sp. No.11243]